MRDVPPKVLEAVLDAATALLAESGASGLTIECLATGAGTSRTSLHRYGIGLPEVRAGLTERLLAEARAELFPILAAREGLAAAQLERALRAIFRVADRHLPVFVALLVGEEPAGQSDVPPCGPPYGALVEPLLGLLPTGRADGSLRVSDGAEGLYATALFSTAVAGYVRLRWTQRLSASQAEEAVLALTLDGLRPSRAAS